MFQSFQSFNRCASFKTYRTSEEALHFGKNERKRTLGRPLSRYRIETDEHLHRWVVYIDLNMVRAGVVNHPSKWQDSGFVDSEAT